MSGGTRGAWRAIRRSPCRPPSDPKGVAPRAREGVKAYMEMNAVGGVARPGFEAVREAFVENFRRRNELGAACCVYHRGEKVVDL